METDAKTLRCTFCGHENPAGNRFCGMCAHALGGSTTAKAAQTATAKPVASQQTSAVAKPEAPAPLKEVSPATAPPKEPPKAAAAPATTSPPEPPKPAPHVPAPASATPVRRPQPSKDLTYLLEDEHEQPTSRVWIGVVLVFLVLFGFFLWQMGGLEAFLKWYQGGKPQIADTQPVDGTTGTTPVPAASPTPETKTASAPAESEKPAEPTPPKEEPKEEPKQESTSEPKKAEEPPAPPEPKPEVKKAPPPKPRPQPVVAKPVRPAPAASDPVTECDRRLSFLRAGDSRGEAGATAQLGTMYYEGRCVARDLPTAYRLYARALHKDPNNSQIADTIANIWKQMSPAERQLAIKQQ